MKCALPVGRVSVLGRPACLRLDREPVLAAQFIEVVGRTSANEVCLEGTIGRSPTIGFRRVSLVVFAHRHTRWLVSGHASSPP